jgi:hypothetical protein
MPGSRKITCRIAFEPDARESIEADTRGPVAFKHGSAEWEEFFSILVCSFQSPLLPSKHHLDDVRQWSNRAEGLIAHIGIIHFPTQTAHSSASKTVQFALKIILAQAMMN